SPSSSSYTPPAARRHPSPGGERHGRVELRLLHTPHARRLAEELGAQSAAAPIPIASRGVPVSIELNFFRDGSRSSRGLRCWSRRERGAAARSPRFLISGLSLSLSSPWMPPSQPSSTSQIRRRQRLGGPARFCWVRLGSDAKSPTGAGARAWAGVEKVAASRPEEEGEAEMKPQWTKGAGEAYATSTVAWMACQPMEARRP
ncbi:unnamed protein product, partial [Urochloa humidicola]